MAPGGREGVESVPRLAAGVYSTPRDLLAAITIVSALQASSQIYTSWYAHDWDRWMLGFYQHDAIKWRHLMQSIIQGIGRSKEISTQQIATMLVNGPVTMAASVSIPPISTLHRRWMLNTNLSLSRGWVDVVCGFIATIKQRAHDHEAAKSSGSSDRRFCWLTFTTTS